MRPLSTFLGMLLLLSLPLAARALAQPAEKPAQDATVGPQSRAQAPGPTTLSATLPGVLLSTE